MRYIAPVRSALREVHSTAVGEAVATKLGRAERIRAALWLGRSVVAITWFYNGLLLKILDGSGRHAAIVQEALHVSRGSAITVTVWIGALECVVGLFVLTGRRRWEVCMFQVAAVASMNLAGALGAADLVGDLPGLAVQNAAFAGLVVAVAALGDIGHVAKS